MYNSEDFIERCLNSILDQNLNVSDYEIIIADDGSQDDSVSIVNRFIAKAHNITLIQGENEGVYFKRNELFRRATGIYVYFVDADDYLIKGALDSLLNIALEKKLDVVGFETCITSVEEYKVEKVDNASARINSQSGLSFIAKNRGMRHEIWWYFVRREFLLSNSITFEEGNFSADVLFTLHIFIKAKKVGYYPVSIHRYFQSPNSITRSQNPEHRFRVIESQIKMILDYSKLINSFENRTNEEEVVKRNFIHRRDCYSFFIIVRMLRSRLIVKEVKRNINSLKYVNAYPFSNFVRAECSSRKYKLLNYIFNNERILYLVIYINNILPK